MWSRDGGNGRSTSFVSEIERDVGFAGITHGVSTPLSALDLNADQHLHESATQRIAVR